MESSLPKVGAVNRLMLFPEPEIQMLLLKTKVQEESAPLELIFGFSGIPDQRVAWFRNVIPLRSTQPLLQ